MKRAFDFAAVVLSAPLWLPLTLAVALAVRIADGKPVLFRQNRAGKGGRVFVFLKFRTMRPGAGSDKERTTRLGGFLRRTSLDELPQLFHVLSGKMSLVGPRPLPERYLELYSAGQSVRHRVRPGMTGWAQVNGRNAVSWDERLAMDAWYVRNRTMLLDVKILFKTFALAASGKGVDASGCETMPEFEGSGQRPSSQNE